MKRASEVAVVSEMFMLMVMLTRRYGMSQGALGRTHGEKGDLKRLRDRKT